MIKAHKKISVLGSGWLGFPLSEKLINCGNSVKASTTSQNRFEELLSIKAEPFLIDINCLSQNINKFLESEILIINIPSKNVEGFKKLLIELKLSQIEKVIFISSTSVYENSNKTIFESDNLESSTNPLVLIENLFKNCNQFKTTILRFGGLIGYNRHPGKFFGSSGFIPNPGSFVNLIHCDDCIEIINQIIRQEVWAETFNCCADTHPTRREFYTKAVESCGLASPRFIDSDTNTFKIISNLKVKSVLNYKFLHPDLLKIDFI